MIGLSLASSLSSDTPDTPVLAVVGPSLQLAHSSLRAMLTMMGMSGGDEEIWRARVTAANIIELKVLGDVDDDGYVRW